MQRIPDQLPQAHFGPVNAVVFADNRLFTAGTDQVIKVWNDKLQSTGSYKAPSGVLSLCQGTQGNYFSGEMDGKLRCWHFSLESVGKVFGEQEGDVTTLAALGNALLSGSRGGSLYLWDSTGQGKKLTDHTARINCLLFKSAQVAISGSSDQTVKIWDLQQERCQETIEGHQGKVSALALHPNGAQFFSASDDATIKLWDLRKIERCLGTLRPLQGPIRALCVAPTGSHLVVGGDGVQVIDLQNLAIPSAIRSSPPTCMAIQNSRLAVGTISGGLNQHLLSTGTISLPEVPQMPGGWLPVHRDQGVEPGRLFLFQAQVASLTHLGFYYPYVLTRGADGKVTVHALSVEKTIVEEKCSLTLSEEVIALGFLPNQKWVYVVTSQLLLLYDPEQGGKKVAEYPVSSICAAAQRGHVVVLGTAQGKVHVYHAHHKKGRCLNESSFFSLASPPPIVALDLYEDEVFTLDRQGELKIWSMSQNTCHSPLASQAKNAQKYFLSYSHAKETLTLATEEKVLRFRRDNEKWSALKEEMFSPDFVRKVLSQGNPHFASREGELFACQTQNQVALWDLVDEKWVEQKKVCENVSGIDGKRTVSTLAFSPFRNLFAYGDDKGFVTISAIDLKRGGQEIDSNIPKIGKDQIKSLKLIASGNFGQVYKGTLGSETVAFKELGPPRDGDHAKQKRDFVQEVQAMWQLRGYPHFTTLYGYCADPLGLVMQYEERGTLKSLLDSGASLSSVQRLQIALGVVDGLFELHRRNVLHADLKSDNVLLDQQGKTKLADFGLTYTSSYSCAHYIEQEGDLFWQAPEVIEKVLEFFRTGQQKRILYTQAADIYSLGLILYHIFTGKAPFDEKAFNEKEVIGGKRPSVEGLPQNIVELIQACWQKDVKSRPSIEKVCETLKALVPPDTSSTVLLSSSQPKAAERLLHCPVPPFGFTGRVKELKALQDKFAKHPRVAITGMGGMGKSTLSIKFAEQHLSTYNLIYFISGDTPETLEQGLIGLANKLHIAEGKQEDRLAALKSCLVAYPKPFLLLFDGVDSNASFEALKKYLPERNGAVLITSRREKWSEELNFSSTPLTPWDPIEAAEYLLGKAKSEEKQPAAALANHLGCLPLAVEQAGSYIRENNLSIADYLTAFRQKHVKLFEQHERADGTNHQRTILTTWQVSIDAIEKEHRCPLAVKLLTCSCFLSSGPTSRVVFEKWLETTLPEVNSDELLRTLRLLKDYSLMHCQEKQSYSFHPLFQEVIRERLSAEERVTCLSQALQALTACVQDKRPEEPVHWLFYRRLMPHIEAVKNRCEGYFKKPFPLFNPFILFNRYERYLSGQGLLTPCEKMCRFNLELARLIHLGEHADVATALYRFARVCWGQGKLVEAELQYKEALEIFTRVCGTKEHPSVAATIHELGIVYQLQGKLVEGELQYKEALEIFTRVYGTKEHPSVATTIHELGRVYQLQGKLVEGELQYKEALEISTRVYGTKEHPLVAATIHELGNVYQLQGKLVEGELQYKEALEIKMRVYGTKEHPSVATTINNLGFVYQAQGKLVEAEKKYKEVLEIETRVYGTKEHPSVATTIHELGFVYQAQGKLVEAEKKYKEALEISTRVYGTKEHPLVATTIHNLASVYKVQGKLVEAEKQYKEVLEIETRVYGTKEHPEVATTIHMLGYVYQAQGKPAEAVAHFREALGIRKRMLRDNHPHTILSEQELAKLQSTSDER